MHLGAPSLPERGVRPGRAELEIRGVKIGGRRDSGHYSKMAIGPMLDACGGTSANMRVPTGHLPLVLVLLG